MYLRGQVDLRDALVSQDKGEGVVSSEQGYALAESIGALTFVETSAKEGNGMKQLVYDLQRLCIARAKKRPIVKWSVDTDDKEIVRPFRAPAPQAEEAEPTPEPEPEVTKGRIIETNVYEAPRADEPNEGKEEGQSDPRPADKKELTGKGGKKIHDSDDGCCVVM